MNFLGNAWNFVAEAEGYTNSWINWYRPFVREYAANGVFLTAEEIKEDLNPVWQYFTGVYWALATVGGWVPRRRRCLPAVLPLAAKRWHEACA